MEENIFEQKSKLKTYLHLAMPVVIGMVITIIYNIADTYFVSQTNNTMLIAGVSLCAPIFTILMAFGNIYGQGGSSLIARLFGKRDTEDAKRVSSFCFYVAILTGVLIGLILIVFSTPLLKVLGADSETISYARPYYLTMAAGSPFLVTSFIHTNLLRSEGLAKESMFGNVAGLLVNIILDPIFILGLSMGSFGAALASVIGYAVTDGYLFYVVIKKSKLLSIDVKNAKISKEFIGQIFGVGISAAVTNWMSSICLIIMNHFLLPYGNDCIAAMGICQKVSMIVLLIATGMVFGSAPMVGYFYGGKRYTELKQILRMVLGLVEGVTIAISLFVFIAAEPAIGMFLKESRLISMGTLMLRFQVVTMCLAVFVMFATVCFQASGLAKEAMVSSILRQGILFLVVIFICANLFGYMGVVASQAATDIVTIVFVGNLFYRRFYVRLH